MTKIFNLLFIPIYALAIYVHSVILSKKRTVANEQNRQKSSKEVSIIYALFV